MAKISISGIRPGAAIGRDDPHVIALNAAPSTGAIAPLRRAD